MLLISRFFIVIFMLLQLFLNKNLALHFYYSEKSFKNNLVTVENLYLIAPGLPQFTHKSFFQRKVNKNTAFFQLYYYGSWFSGGKFLFKNCLKSTEDALAFVAGGQGIKTFDNRKLKWSHKNLFLVGNSFGANVVLATKADKQKVKKIVLYAPFFVEYSNVRDNKKTLDFLARGYQNNFRGIHLKEWQDYFAKKDKLSFLAPNNNFPPIEIIHGKKDTVVPFQLSQKLQNKYPDLIKLKLKNEAGHSMEELYEI